MSPPGTAHALRAQASDGETGLYPFTNVYNSAGALDQAVPLSHLAGGLYGFTAYFPTPGTYYAVTQFWSDAGHTVDAGYERVGEEFVIAAAVASPLDVLDELLSAHSISGSAGAALSTLVTRDEAALVLDALTSAHAGAGTVGAAIGAVAGQVSTVGAAVATVGTAVVASAADVATTLGLAQVIAAWDVGASVLDASLANHLSAGSVGEAVALVLGLSQSNQLVDQCAYNATGLLISARVRIFPSAADVAAETSQLASFVVEQTPDAAPYSARPLAYRLTRTS